MNDWKWTLYQAKRMPVEKLMVLKMADANDTISYAIATLRDGKLEFRVQENPLATLVVAFMQLPD